MHTQNTAKQPHTEPSADESKKTHVTLINYNEKEFEEKEITDPKEADSYKDHRNVTWIDIDGIYNKETVNHYLKYVKLHPLVQEDIFNTNQRPKAIDYEENVYVVLKLLSYDEEKSRVRVEQLSIVLSKNFLITFQEKEGDGLAKVKELIRAEKSRIRVMKADFLLYAIFDSVVDNYFTILERIGERIDILEKKVIDAPTPKTLQKLNSLKKEIIYLRKSVWPMREVIRSLERDESPLIQKPTWLYFRDVYDHTIQVIDTMETYRDILSNVMDIYLSSISNRLNEVMKVLTIISTIFIPLTFITSLYGMNFDYLPELKYHYAYPTVLAFMLVSAIGMILYFKSKKWW